jgi:DNA-binding NtrC family response regulator
VGARRARRIALRVVAASNRDLAQLVAQGQFRADLYHRLNVLEVHVPPLRERSGDVAALARAFAASAAQRAGLAEPELADDLMQFLARYDFPGNVRELEHLLTKLVVLAEGPRLTLGDLPPSLAAPAARLLAPVPPHAGAASGPPAATASQEGERGAGHGPSPAPEALLAQGPISLDEVEERLLREAIRLAGGNLSEAARRLGLSYKTLRYRAGKLRG